MRYPFKIGVLVPTRGREIFLAQAKYLLSRQNVKPNYVEFVDYAPESDRVDVTQRYRRGCKTLFKRGCEVVIFWEDDDWYAPNYIHIMVDAWIRYGRPGIFGIDSSTYYHILHNKYVIIRHRGRASAMATMVTKRILNIKWPADDDPYLDVHLWKQMRGRTFTPRFQICLCIKHGIGMVGGGAHNGDSKHYKVSDPNSAYLKSIVGKDFHFYQNLKNAAVQ